MASMCATFHCHVISSLENTRVGHFCPPPPQIKYPTPDTPNKIGLKHEIEFIIKKIKLKNKIQQLLSKYKHGNNIHE